MYVEIYARIYVETEFNGKFPGAIKNIFIESINEASDEKLKAFLIKLRRKSGEQRQRA